MQIAGHMSWLGCTFFPSLLPIPPNPPSRPQNSSRDPWPSSLLRDGGHQKVQTRAFELVVHIYRPLSDVIRCPLGGDTRRRKLAPSPLSLKRLCPGGRGTAVVENRQDPDEIGKGEKTDLSMSSPQCSSSCCTCSCLRRVCTCSPKAAMNSSCNHTPTVYESACSWNSQGKFLPWQCCIS